eukprot:TRINITY_DN1166_c3_g1_i1.p1 TRINITY_DN1166_c3_g1~~TRINITY_DN1166_c3_g1_i1.p1  ORF type:complete len:1057 (+),score=210.70 TRINITY_DN1166_c3_g1_i1:117-3287(+)
MDQSSELKLGAYRKQNLQNRIKEDPHGLVQSNSAPTPAAEKLLDPESRVLAEKKRHGINFLWETAAYLLFVATLVCVLIFSIPPDGYDAVALTRHLFLNRTAHWEDLQGNYHETSFYKVQSADDFFNWLTHLFFPLIFQERDASGREFTEYERLFLLMYNRILGPVRLRQVRVGRRSCDFVDQFATDLDVRQCYAPFSMSAADKESFGPTYLFNGKSGYSMREIDSFVAQGYALNVTEIPRSRYKYQDSSMLCSEEPDAARDVGATVDHTGRPILGGNSGLSFWCRLGAGTVGKLGTIYPNGGYVEDFPPGSWYSAWNDYRSVKLDMSNEWNRRIGPRAPPQFTTVTEPVRDGGSVPTTTRPLPTDTPCLLNVSCTLPAVVIKNATATVPIVGATVTPMPVPTTTPLYLGIPLPEFPSKRDYSLDHLAELKRFQWVRPGTSAVVVEFTLYNANVRTGVVSRLVFEFLPTGAVVPYASVKTLDLYEVETFHEGGVLLGEMILTLWVGYYLLVELRKIKRYVSLPWRHCQVCCMNKIRREALSPIIVCPNCQRPFHPFLQPYCPDCYQNVHQLHQCWRGYFQDVWNVIDFVNITIFIVVFGYRYKMRFDLAAVEIRTETQFIQFYPIAWQQSFVKYLNSFNVIFSFMKLVKYLGKIRVLGRLMATMRISIVPLVNLLGIVALLLLGFSLAFMLAFGGDVYDYRDLGYAMVSLFRMWTGKGEFDWAGLEDSNEPLADILYLSFTICMCFVITYVVVAVICEAHAAAGIEVKRERVDYLNSALKLILRNIRNWLNRYFRGSENLLRMKMLLVNLQQVPNLKRDQRDDVRAFHRQMDDEPDEELMHEILKAFHHDVNRVMRMEDYTLLTTTVIRHKREKKASEQPTQGIWGVEEDEEPEPSAPPWQLQSAAAQHGAAAARAVQAAQANRMSSAAGPSTSLRIHALMGRLDVLEDGIERVQELLKERGSILDPEQIEEAHEARRRATRSSSHKLGGGMERGQRLSSSVDDWYAGEMAPTAKGKRLLSGLPPPGGSRGIEVSPRVRPLSQSSGGSIGGSSRHR